MGVRRVAACLALIACVSSSWVSWRIWTTPYGTHTFTEMSRLGGFQLVVPPIVSALATWFAWRGRFRWLTVLAVSFYAYAFLEGFSIGASYLPAAAALFASSLAAVIGRLVARLRLSRNSRQRVGQ